MRFLSLRAFVLLAFVVAMPVLALPPVARRIDEWLYGPPPTDFGRPPAAAPAEPTVDPTAAKIVSPASFVDSQPATLAPAVGPPQPAPTTAPPLAKLPAAAPFDHSTAPAGPSPVKVDERMLARLQEIRLRLEHLGAEYVVVETLESAGRYRFHCRMLIDERSRFTRPFEVNSADPVSAGEQVLREVEAWRRGGAVAK